ncbi:uncharacterized protein FIBRA_06525 [Fibroporia radiculosa]|uniref:RRM domain-containing protein n=1 Tax=Fibroporia radiculosa TaxID=599839 RepID=J4GBR7_9APHY|nr:uncharacterized protein FIBRA_06525 [Fibroporia radiculosa]CCM04353.1 predicted protein [Fibroporia radiculosa]
MANSLGKRKQREGDEAHLSESHGSTLFVSNLPYSATSVDLQTLFSDFAPVRSAFVVLDQASGISKGVGYVSFAIKEDAQMALEKVDREGIALDGRSLRLQWPNNKSKDKSSQNKVKITRPEDLDARKAKPSRPSSSSAPRDPLAIRTVVITGLPRTADSKTIWKKIRKLEGAEKVDCVDSSAAHALFVTPATAMEAANKLHAHVFKGSLLSATLKKRLDGLANAPKKLQAAKEKGPAPNRASRLIVRNLPFDITEQDLRAVFLPYGPIYSIDIPSVEAPKPEEEDVRPSAAPRKKGFAFVWMLSRMDAERAMEQCNGIAVEAGMAERLVSDKQKRKKQRREEQKIMKASGAVGHAELSGDNGGESGGEEEGVAGKKLHSTRRIIAVDWALSKERWEKEKARVEQKDIEMERLDGDEDSGSESSASESDSDRGDDEDEELLGVHEDDDEYEEKGGASGEDGSDDGAEEPSKPVLPPPETGTTLFVRNVPFEATEDELRTLFRAFGPLRYARITMDHEIGRSRGTGFVCFWNKADADKAIEQSELLRAETVTNKVAVHKKNPFKLPSLLTPDPSASVAQNLVLQGRTLDVIRAVTRDEAGKLKEEGERQREKADKRNLYLLREGIILPNSPAAETMNPAEVEKRTQSFNARRTLLRSNPSLYVSRTRLSIRQLPVFVTERIVKRLAIHAVRKFEKEVKEGIRQRLSEDELLEARVAEDEDTPAKTEVDEGGAKKPLREQHKKGGRPTGVKQAKIVRQSDRVDAVTGKGRSKGYGFLEMTSHADALRVLRWANNNPAVATLFEEWWKAELEDLVKIEKAKPKKDETRLKRIVEELGRGAPARNKGTLIVEFSIENVQVVQRRAAHQRDTHQKGEVPKVKRRVSLSDVKREQSEERPIKKRRTSEPHGNSGSPTKAKEEKAKSGQQVGSLIGRKRKERKSKKRAS